MANKRRRANRNAHTRMVPRCTAKEDASKRAGQGQKLFFVTLVLNMFQTGSLRRTLFFCFRNFSANPKRLIGLSPLAGFIHPRRSIRVLLAWPPSPAIWFRCSSLEGDSEGAASPTSRGRFRRLVVKWPQQVFNIPNFCKVPG